jgi:putative multiple sugar transport system permease protein
MSFANNPTELTPETAASAGVATKTSFGQNMVTILRQNIREYGMYIALFVIMAFFTWRTDGVFISARNISNLVNQTGYIAVLAVGMTLVIVIRHIDLSVGFLAGFMGAVAAIAMVQWNLPVFVVIPLVLFFGVLAGLLTAFPVAQLGIPSFVASLAGWLIYRGAILLVTMGTGTIIIPNDAFNAIGNGYIPDIPGMTFLPEMHKLTLLLGIVAAVLFVLNEFRNRKAKQAYNLEVLPMDIFVLKLVFVVGLLGYITWTLASYRGLSWTLVVVLLVTGIYDFVSQKTVLGRHIYAVGGNPEAAELSGINVKKIIFWVFGSMGMLSALSGILFASRLQSATTTAGSLFELDAIAAAYVGGVSAAGGVGKIIGSLIGALVMMSLTSGMNLMGIDISIQYIVRGAVLTLAVIFDVYTRNRGR